MKRSGEKRWVRGMQDVKTYQDYLDEYNKKIAKQRKKRLKQAKKRLEKMKKLPQYQEYVKNQTNPWLILEPKDLSQYPTTTSI